MKVTRRALLGGLVGGTTLAALGCGRPPAGARTSQPTPTPGADGRAASSRAIGAPTLSTPLAPTPTSTIVPPRPTVTPTPRPPTATAVVAPAPRQLEIPRIAVSAPIVPIGTTPSGELDAPTGPHEVGWFAGGPKPSEPGNALLTGHLDWRSGETAVFWRLKELGPGDELYVRTEQGRLRFEVESSWLYERDNAPVTRILGFQIGRVITIVTCEGRFLPYQDRPGGDYTQRRVVRARFVPIA